jgi:succinyl-diaminopimelate desuccinylase
MYGFLFANKPYNAISMRELLKKLIQTAPIDQNGEKPAAAVLQNYLNPLGIETKIDCYSDKNANFMSRIRGTGHKKALLFAGHLDVVPACQENWTFPAFEGFEQDGKICGRGATDMLGGLASIAAAMAEIKQENHPLQGDLIFAATAAEETDSSGVKHYLKNTAKTIGELCGIIVPEPTGLEVIRAHRGILWLEIAATGKTAHGSMPQLGINAIEKIMAFLNLFKTYQIPHQPHPLLGGCSVSVNKIVGGQAANIVPDSCSVQIDIRTLPGQAHNGIQKDIEQLFDQLKQQDKHFKAKITVMRSVPALETPEDNPFLITVCKAVGVKKAGAVGFTTDGPWFAKLNAPVLIFGPGSPQMCHKPDEYIDIEQLEKAKDAYKRIILEVLS